MTKHINGLADIHKDFDTFLIDQYGVLHNGVQPYQFAVETLRRLKQLDKRIVIISNSGKRSKINKQRMAKLGFSEHLYDHFITSGEVAFQFLESRPKDSTAETCYLLSRDNDTSAIENLDLRRVEHPDAADIIVISGSESERYSENDYRALLRLAAINNKICFCTNPDKLMLSKNGLVFGAGRIAEIYEELGGKVHWIGKPFPSIYQYSLSLYDDVERSRVLCIGDSIEHDIAGGQNAQLKTMLVLSGICNGATTQQLESQFLRYNATPGYISAEFKF